MACCVLIASVIAALLAPGRLFARARGASAGDPRAWRLRTTERSDG
jgi:hypothetical protein